MPSGLPVVIGLKRNGTVASIDGLIDARIIVSLLETSVATIRFADPTMEKLDGGTWNIGDELVILAEVGSTATPVFDGEIVAIGAEQRADTRHELVIEAMDRSHRLSAVVTPQTFLKQKYSQIVATLARAYGLRADVTDSKLTHDYLMQTVSDRAFLSFMADDIGFEWFVDGKKLVFRQRPAPGTAAVTLKWSTNLMRFEARASAVDVATSITVRGWNPITAKEVAGKTTMVTSDSRNYGSDAPLAMTAATKSKGFGKAVNLVPGVVQDVAEANMRAQAIAADVQGSMMRATGEAMDEPGLKPGVWVAIAECGASLSGKYYVTECEHVFGANQSFRTRFKMTGRRDTSLVGRSEPQSRGFGQIGLVVGIVTNIKDAETSTQRVRVKFPSMPGLESAWARVVTLGGGGNRGGLDMRPEVNDEVLVGFEHGDLRRPFVIGGLLGPKDTDLIAAIDSNGKVINRGIRTRTGNSVVLSDGDGDAAGKRSITVTTADKKSIVRVGEDKISVTTAAAVPIELVSGSASIKIDNGAITINGKSLAVKTEQGIKFEGMTVDVKGTTAVQIDGGSKLAGKGGLLQLEADGLASVKGSMLKLN